MSESKFWAKIILTVLNAGVIAVNYMKWSAALTLCRCRETPPLFITTPLAPAGPLWPKVFGGPKNPGRWPRGRTDEAQSSLGSDSGTWLVLARFWPDSGNAANVSLEPCIGLSCVSRSLCTEPRLGFYVTANEFFFKPFVVHSKECRLRIRSVLRPTFSCSCFPYSYILHKCTQSSPLLFAAAHYLSSKQSVARSL